MKNTKAIKTTLLSLMIIFVLILTFFITLIQDKLLRGFFIVVALLGLAFLVLGIRLLFLAKKQKTKVKIPLLITGISAITLLVGAILHNLFYALAITFQNLKLIFEILHISFFLLSILVAPITFLIGAIWSLILLRKQ